MPTDLKSALAALAAQEPLSLLGLRETQWLDAKGGPYQLANPRSVEELAKDVAGFANGGGGLIVIGIATRLEHDEEVLDHVVEVAPAAVNLDQIRKLIRMSLVISCSTPGVLHPACAVGPSAAYGPRPCQARKSSVADLDTKPMRGN